jgi:GAF domain-containing protein
MNGNNRQPNAPRVPTGNRLPAWLHGWKGLAILGAGIYLLVYSTWIIYKWTNPAYEVLIAGLGYIPLGIFSAACTIYTATQKRLDVPTRRSWALIALGMVILPFADILYTILENTGGVGFPDIPDIFYLLYYPLAFFGLVSMPAKVYEASQAKTWKLDLAIIITSSTAMLWYFIIAPTAVAGGESWAEVLVAGAYPAMDMLLLASIASILFRNSEVNTRRSLYILGLGLLIYVLADVAYLWLVLEDLYISGSWVDILWTVSYFVVGVAALRQATPYLTETDSDQALQGYWRASLLPFIALGAAVIVSLFASTIGTGNALQNNGLYVATVLAIFLTIFRQGITIRENAILVEELRLATIQLQDNARILEERVVERTRELEKQTDRLQLATRIARDAASAADLEKLLDRSTTLILDRFNLYHTAIYLIDQKREYLVLIASPTEAGKQMMADNHRISVNDLNTISQVVATGEPRIAQDTGREVMRFKYPLLPNTLSEMAIPLKVENKTIGVLDVQSDRPQAFSENDIATMQHLADQLAIGIERARLLEQVEENLKELQQAYGRSTHESWKSLAESKLLGNLGYRFDNVRIQPIQSTPELGAEAIRSGNSIIRREGGDQQADETLAAIPIKLRGQTIGAVTVRLKEGYRPTTISTIEQAVERLSASLESARLFEEARARADREQAISQVTSAISSTSEFDSILRTTIEEIGKTLGDSEIGITILEEIEQ